MDIDGIPYSGPNLFSPKGHYWNQHSWCQTMHSEHRPINGCTHHRCWLRVLKRMLSDRCAMDQSRISWRFVKGAIKHQNMGDIPTLHHVFGYGRCILVTLYLVKGPQTAIFSFELLTFADPWFETGICCLLVHDWKFKNISRWHSWTRAQAGFVV